MLRRHTPALRYPAKETHRRYGICSRAAGESTLRKERIIRRISPHSAHSHSKARPKTWKLKKRMLQRKLKASWIPKSCRLRERAAEGGWPRCGRRRCPSGRRGLPRLWGTPCREGREAAGRWPSDRCGSPCASASRTGRPLLPPGESSGHIVCVCAFSCDITSRITPCGVA